MNLEKLSEPLSVKDIDFRIQSINKGGYATILAYKDARVDINRLNNVCGPLGWQRSHSRDNQNCAVSIYDQGNNQWVSKEDTGTESFTEAAKGLASDSFKRACFNWGIGIELYDYPVIQVQLNGNGDPVGRGDKVTEWFLNPKKKDKYGNAKPDATWNLKLKEWEWRIDVCERVVTYIAVKDQAGIVRFSWGKAALKAVLENQSSVDAITKALDDDSMPAAAEAWFEIDVDSRKHMYVSEKHGGPFNTDQRNRMKSTFMEHYPGDTAMWEGLFSVVPE